MPCLCGSLSSSATVAARRGAWPGVPALVSALCFTTRSFAGHCYVAPDRSRASRVIDSVRLYPAFTPGDPHADGFGFPQRFRIEVSDDVPS